jgi:hypothetical protein
MSAPIRNIVAFPYRRPWLSKSPAAVTSWPMLRLERSVPDTQLMAQQRVTFSRPVISGFALFIFAAIAF